MFYETFVLQDFEDLLTVEYDLKKGKFLKTNNYGLCRFDSYKNNGNIVCERLENRNDFIYDEYKLRWNGFYVILGQSDDDIEENGLRIT